VFPQCCVELTKYLSIHKKKLIQNKFINGYTDEDKKLDFYLIKDKEKYNFIEIIL